MICSPHTPVPSSMPRRYPPASARRPSGCARSSAQPVLARVTTQARPFETDLGDVAADAVMDLDQRIRTPVARRRARAAGRPADPLQMRQLLQNLIANALKFSRPGVPPVSSWRLSVRRRRLDDRVADNGIGFDESIRSYLRRSSVCMGGTNSRRGIGPASATRSRARHGGTLTAQSTRRGDDIAATPPNQPRS